MKIASYNVNSIRVRLPLLLDWLSKNHIDLLCVQETKVQDKDFPAEAFEQNGYNCIFKGQKSYNGVAILSRYQAGQLHFGFEDEPTDGPRLIRAQLNAITVVNTYVPQGVATDSEKFRYKLRWLERLLAFFKKNFDKKDPVLWVGDLNLARLPIDVYDPERLSGHVCYHPEVTRRLEKIMQWGFVDLFRQHCTEPRQYTFWDYRLPNAVKRHLGWRLDYIMATKSLADKSTNCYIDKQPRLADRPSDHTPIIAELKI